MLHAEQFQPPFQSAEAAYAKGFQRHRAWDAEAGRRCLSGHEGPLPRPQRGPCAKLGFLVQFTETGEHERRPDPGAVSGLAIL